MDSRRGGGLEADGSWASFRFEYDAWNRRASRWGAGSGSREYIHDPAGHLLAEMKYRSTTLVTYEASREYVWLDGRPLAQLEYPGPPGRAEGYTYYFHLDHLGQPRALSNESKVTVWSVTPSRPYGDVAEVTTVDPLTGRVITTDLRLPGQYDERLLGALGLQGPYYNWNRWYLPAMGRYLELDPIALHGGFNGPFGPNWYGYAEGSPLRRIDPRGLDATDQWNTADGCRLPFLVTGSAPTNGMWCGDKWSGGSGTCRGQGQSPPTDSLDLACMQHDLCYSECSSHRSAALMQACNVLCDRALTRDVRCLGPDPSRWPGPPRPGTGADTTNYRESLLNLFGCPPKERNTCPK